MCGQTSVLAGHDYRDRFGHKCRVIRMHMLWSTLASVAEAVRQILMEADVEGLIGAGRHERSADRLNYRNGYRDRSFDTRLGPPDSLATWTKAGFEREIGFGGPDRSFPLLGSQSRLPMIAGAMMGVGVCCYRVICVRTALTCAQCFPRCRLDLLG
jgi:hypothetical protein